MSKSIRIGVFADAHANLEATELVYDIFKKEECETIYCLGDVIGIGPQSQETLDYIMNSHNTKMVLGNHEIYALSGIVKQDLKEMSKDEIAHHNWVKSLLTTEQIQFLKQQPLVLHEQFFNTNITFLHSSYTKDNDSEIVYNNLIFKNIKEIESKFIDIDSDIICYGHSHIFSDLELTKRYINPGSLGCQYDDMIRCSIIEISSQGVEVKHIRIKYNKENVIEKVRELQYPDYKTILKVFYNEE